MIRSRGAARTETPTPRVFRRADLFGDGLTKRDISAAVTCGDLIRARDGIYLTRDAPAAVVDACRVGGRLACVSELARHGVFVMDRTALHVHLPRAASRLRKLARPVRTHWGELRRFVPARAASVSVFDALLQAVRCQGPRAAVATLDSALHLGVLMPDELDELFAALPNRYRALRPLLDPRAESGTETLVRLILRALGLRFEVQVDIRGVGRVDFVVQGWLIIECDSRAHHSDWEAQRRDRRRDLAAAEAGYVTLRLLAEDILWNPARVRAAITGVTGHFQAKRRTEGVRDGRPRRVA